MNEGNLCQYGIPRPFLWQHFKLKDFALSLSLCDHSLIFCLLFPCDGIVSHFYLSSTKLKMCTKAYFLMGARLHLRGSRIALLSLATRQTNFLNYEVLMEA